MGEPVKSANPTYPTTYKRPTTLATNTQFVRDNSTYRVRFSATDALKRRCESSVDVQVGTPPIAPSGVANMVQQSLADAPQRGSGTKGVKRDLVVLPFQDQTMQHAQDHIAARNFEFVTYNHLLNTLNALVIQKGSVGATTGPRILGEDDVELEYSAAANPSDPVGAGSINSTSQNYPLNKDITKFSSLLSSTIQKTDQWETPLRLPTDLNATAADYKATSFMQNYYVAGHIWQEGTDGLPKPDEGYFPYFTLDDFARYDLMKETDANWTADGAKGQYDYYVSNAKIAMSKVSASQTHGAYMPGVNNPYVANDAQAFTSFDGNNQVFVAQTVPITDVDDVGRVNPKPLLRVNVKTKGGVATLAKTDAVLSNSRDLQCRGCHAKGKIAANSSVVFKPGDGTPDSAMIDATVPTYLNLKEAAALNPDTHINPDSQSLFDQEWAALMNINETHGYYTSGQMFTKWMEKGVTSKSTITGKDVYWWDVPYTCNNCHVTSMYKWPLSEDNTTTYNDAEFGAHAGDGASYTRSMHMFHGQLQYNADKTDIVRDANGRHVRFDVSKVTKRAPNAEINPNTLFPTFDKDGKQLPAEENCVRCHAGHREQLYNDRMFTAGKTCFDCHGDMLAVGKAFPKVADKTGSKHLTDYRFPWLDQPECGSCHVGNGNVGKDAKNGFFSAGIKQRAFEDTDPAAIPRKVDKNNPDAVRFAVIPDHVEEYRDTSTTSPAATPATDHLKVSMPLYRFGKDTHGDVACAACHGSAHSISPNRDPNANNNV
ncbi:MAG: cytochrome C, partial [Methylococcales bacterium]|nr:cytochrome C [Methylococcales bacterium]